jgi:hypothetical protein
MGHASYYRRPLVLSDQDREQLERMARSSSLPHRSVRQAKALIWAADGCQMRR